MVLKTDPVENPVACIAYYCSGHGYGHATRVSAFARTLLNLSKEQRPGIYIVSSAPEHVFSDSIACGAQYRCAEIDPVIVQPLAYQVDRPRSVAVLKSFLAKKDEMLERECRWLRMIEATAVFSDAAFLGCLAAKTTGLPSVLITNFSFDSVFSFLSTNITEDRADQLHPAGFEGLLKDEPISRQELEPLVDEILSGYRCADLLLLLPGCIPMPSFYGPPSLPASDWVDCETHRLLPQVHDALTQPIPSSSILPPIPFPTSSFFIPRKVIPTPLLCRKPSSDCYSADGRVRILTGLGVPLDRCGTDTKVLIVSFGGQNFHQPSRSGSRSHSGYNSRGSPKRTPPQEPAELPAAKTGATPPAGAPRLTTESHIWLPGAPPALKLPQSPRITSPPAIPTISVEPDYFGTAAEQPEDEEPSLLPDETWIAIVCGVSKDQWLNQGEELPEGFYVAPRHVYMPDLIAVSDVLLGKLGYGTVSECVDTGTPFVYVSRPLFVEEHGLRLLLDRDGFGLELSRSSYEMGDWAAAILEAYENGKPLKEKRRLQDPADSVNQISDLAQEVMHWVGHWSHEVRAAEERCSTKA
ncbi:hypothetical protein BKA70DRAFT_1384105 [Coprinopsis sp. MPI-PUGE-AT-0042]|nr:hypothetical protein BKA70DRAFT_1384105 [Coprinopsis sp. MPI-PUGE-AT-0042]